jgi:hypothetical protein
MVKGHPSDGGPSGRVHVHVHVHHHLGGGLSVRVHRIGDGVLALHGVAATETDGTETEAGTGTEMGHQWTTDLCCTRYTTGG